MEPATGITARTETRMVRQEPASLPHRGSPAARGALYAEGDTGADPLGESELWLPLSKLVTAPTLVT